MSNIDDICQKWNNLIEATYPEKEPDENPKKKKRRQRINSRNSCRPEPRLFESYEVNHALGSY
jgi:hypothetical protein